MEAAKPHLKDVRAVLTLSDTVVMVGDRYYVKATASFVDCDDPSVVVSNDAYAREEDVKKGMDGSQITGSSSSYARKYALNGLFDIDDTKDSDATNDGTGPAPAPRPVPAAPRPSRPRPAPVGPVCQRCKKNQLLSVEQANRRKAETGYVLCDECYDVWTTIKDQEAQAEPAQEGVAEC